MTSPGGQPGGEYVEAIRQDLECPNCQYNLRGLIGAVVTCPECGNNCDVAHLVANRWRKPWFRVPGFNRLALPVGWLVITVLPAFVYYCVLAAAGDLNTSVYWKLMGAAVVIVAVWVWLMIKTTKRFGDVRWFWLALVLHPVVGFYAVAAIAVLIGVLWFVFSFFAMGGPNAMVSVVMSIGGLGVIVCCFLVERYVARQCIRRYLTLQTQVEPGQTRPVAFRS